MVTSQLQNKKKKIAITASGVSRLHTYASQRKTQQTRVVGDKRHCTCHAPMRGKDFEGKGSFMSTFNGAAVTGGNVWRHNANADILIGRTIPQGNARYSVYVIYSLFSPTLM